MLLSGLRVEVRLGSRGGVAATDLVLESNQPAMSGVEQYVLVELRSEVNC